MKTQIFRYKRWTTAFQVALAYSMLAGSSAAYAADWRVVIASVDTVLMVDAATFRRQGQQLTFGSRAYQPKPDADGSIGNVAWLTFDCARRRMKTEQTLDIRPDGSTAPTKEEESGFVTIAPGTIGELFLDRMCRVKSEGDDMNGVRSLVPPDLAAKSIFGLLKLGLDSEQASELATFKYWDEKSLTTSLDKSSVPMKKRVAVRKILASQTVQAPPPPRSIVPLPSAVASGRVGKYTHSEQELVAGLWLRADGTFRYALTVGSLDEIASGRWAAKANRVKLINEPRPVPPSITSSGLGLLEPSAPFSVTLLTPAGGSVPGVDLVVEFERGDPLESYTQQATWVLPIEEKRQPSFITFSWPSYGVKPTRFNVDIKKANVLTFVFTPNDFGVVDLTDLVVEVDSKGLTLHRNDGTMRFNREKQ